MTIKSISALIGSTLLAAAIIIAPKLYAVTYTTNGSSSAVSGFTSDSVAVVSNTSGATATILKLGDKGPEVTTLQKALIVKGYKTVIANGTYDTATFDAVKKYQISQRITADGIFGPTTRSFLYGTGVSAAPTDALVKTNTSGATVSPVKTNSTTVPASTTNGNTVGATVNNTIGTKTTSTTATQAPAGATTSATAGCTSTTAPWIKIISPNGGEVFTAWQKVNVTWESCNISKTQNVKIHTTDSTNDAFSSAYVTVNDGQEFVNLTPFVSSPVYGKYYKMYITVDTGSSFMKDVSDSDFSIIEPKTTTTTTTASVNCTSTTAPWIKVVSPNGGESYKAGEQLTVKWESCNIKGSVYLDLVQNYSNSGFYAWILAESYSNSGQGSFTLPNVSQWGNMAYGKNFKILIGVKEVQTTQQGGVTPTDFSDDLFTVTQSTTTTTCTNWKVTSGGPQGGTTWEKVRDFSGYPEIDQYRIQWFNGNWSPWYTPTIDDKDTKVNNDGSWRYMISYKQDHNWETRDCIDGTGTDSPIDIMTSPRTGPSKEVVQGQKDVEFGRFLITNKNKTAPARPSEIFLTQVGSLTPYSLVDGDSNVKNIALYDTKGKRLTDFTRLGNDGSVDLGNYNEAFSIDKNSYLEVVLRGDISPTATIGKTIAFKAYKGTAHYPSLGTQETIVAVKPDTANSLTIVSGTSTTATCNAKTTGAFTLTNQGTPEGAMFSTGHPPMDDFHFATLSLKTAKTSGPICLNSIQLGALTDPNLKIRKVYIYNTGGKLLATVPMSDWYKIDNNTSWAAWVPLRLDIKKGNTTEKFIIKADVMDSSSVTAGLFNLGISGMTFGGPGARGSSLSFGNVFAVN